jgi:hypothetical protein
MKMIQPPMKGENPEVRAETVCKVPYLSSFRCDFLGSEAKLHRKWDDMINCDGIKRP